MKEPTTLPDLFAFASGERVHTAGDWPRRRAELLQTVVSLEYGGMPPTPGWTRGRLLHWHDVRGRDGVVHAQYRIETGPEGPFGFTLDVLVPPGQGRRPVVLCGDRCWCYVTDDVAAEVLRRGYILATFNRVETVPDDYRADRDSGLYLVYPGAEYGALAAWAWAYHRCVDFLATLDTADAARIAVVGHSRGGKAVLLAGATDERIALTAPNNSGCGGAGCFRIQGEGSETLADILKMVPYWFGPRLKAYIGRESELPFDQHSLKALVAPRALLQTEALGDLWANPTGTWRTHLAAREVYELLGTPENIGIHFREGGHDHGLADWRTFLDFADWRLRGIKPGCRFDDAPFPRA